MRKIFPRNGFTFIELLVAVCIAAVVAVTVFLVFSNGIKLSQRTQSSGERYQEMRLALETIALDLENMVPFSVFNSSLNANESVFQGEENRLTLLLSTDSGLKRTRYYLVSPSRSAVHTTVLGQHFSKNTRVVNVRSEGKKILFLIRAQAPFAPGMVVGDKAEPETEILSRVVPETGLKFWYGKVDSAENKEIVWEKTWRAENFPVAVRVELTFLDPQTQETIFLQRDVLIPRAVFLKDK